MHQPILHAEHHRSWAEEYAASLVSAYAPDCIILFGSVARQEQAPDSDIDILVIGGNLPENQRQRFRLLMRLRPRFAPIQVQSFSRAEWERMVTVRHVTILEALNDGVALYGQRLFGRWRRQFERWQQLGLRRERCAWILPSDLKMAARSMVVHE